MPKACRWVCCGVGLGALAAEWSGVAFLTGGKTGDRREVVCGWKNAVERNAVADAPSLGLCGWLG